MPVLEISKCSSEQAIKISGKKTKIGKMQGDDWFKPTVNYPTERRDHSSRLACVQTHIIRHAHNYMKRMRVSRPHPKEGCLRSHASSRVLLFLGTFDWQFSGLPHTSGTKLDYLLYLLLRARSLVTFFLPRELRKGTPRSFPSPSTAVVSLFPSSSRRRPRRPCTPMRKDVPRMYVDYYGPSRFYSPSGWRAYHRHLVSRD